MSKHSYNKIWIHFIWETLDKQKVLSKPERVKLYEFFWEKGYGAFSVSPISVAKVEAYIRNQGRTSSCKKF